MGLKETILGAEDLTSTEIEVPEWNEKVTIRAFSGAELDSWQQYCHSFYKRNEAVPNMRAKLASLVCVDEAGNRIFTDADVPALGKKSGKALDRIFDAWVSLNKVSEEEAKELEKNS